MKNKNILFIGLPFSGHINPTLGLVEALVKEGYHVTYMIDEDWKETVESYGAQHMPYDNYSSQWPTLKKNAVCLNRAYNTALRIGEHFDLLIYETLFVFGKTLGDRLSVPTVRLFSTFALDDDIMNRFSATGGAHLTLLSKIPIVYKLLNYHCKRKGLIEMDNINDEVIYNNPKLNFVYTSKEFQINPENFKAENYFFVGPSIYQRKNKVKADIPYNSMKGRIIYISLGTLLNKNKEFYKYCIESFKGSEYSVILSIGNEIPLSSFGEIPENIYLYQQVPQLEVLSRSSLFITHGGMNSVNEALNFGIPMIVYPQGNDQPTIAKRIEELHLGLIVEDINTVNLVAMTDRILDDQQMNDSIQEMKNHMQALHANKKIIEVMKEQGFL